MQPNPRRILPVAAAISGLFLFYILHFFFCSQSAVPDFDIHFLNSDMLANRLWAEGIVQQGWLNPQPHHPWNDWMREIAPYETWCQWWGSPAIFQQSPLYAYLLAAFLHVSNNLLVFHFLQCLAGAVLCILLAVLAHHVFRNRSITWSTGILAGIYAPFYAYAWPLLRDLTGWCLIVMLLIFLTRWHDSLNSRSSSLPGLSAGVGFLLGLGLLSRESFYLGIPLLLLAVVWLCFRRKNFKPVSIILIVLLLTLAPLMIRNQLSGAPLLSTSNRFAENFIEGNAPSAKPAAFFIPGEMGAIMSQSHGRPLQVIMQTLETNRDNPFMWVYLQARKAISLFDPFEPWDNVSIYFMEDISPFVRWGIPHWLIFIPGLGGLAWGIRNRDRRQSWMWLLLVSLLAGVLITTVLSRYRQSLALLWIPWAAFFFNQLFLQIRQAEWKKASLLFGFLLFGWWLCLTPFSLRSPEQYHRRTEYALSAWIHEQKGQGQQAQKILRRYEERKREDAE